MYYNPVKILETDNWNKVLDEYLAKINAINPLIVTSKGNFERQNLKDQLKGYQFFTDIEINPNFDSCQRAIDFTKNVKCDSVVAIGGGSVMDTTKVMIAAINTKLDSLGDIFLFKGQYSNDLPKIFIPTTHGTASEVTMWGTIWNYTEKQKYSLANQALYPDLAILDPSLCLSMDLKLTISTTLDALSHSFETLWNVNSNSKSVNYAIEAIKTILEEVPDIKLNPNDLNIRKRLLKASNLAGLAFSNTKTAAAHSISYPLTFSFNIPHGIACSIPIIPLLDINRDFMKDNLEQLLNTLEIDFEELKNQINNIPEDIVDFNLSAWGIQSSDFDEIVDKTFTKSRISNNIIDLSREDIYNILYEIL
jgi:phosphonate metabolism-associated iron-containing alcohol dehydrogenase